jgi:hypothetical protein
MLVAVLWVPSPYNLLEKGRFVFRELRYATSHLHHQLKAVNVSKALDVPFSLTLVLRHHDYHCYARIRDGIGA